MSESAKLTNQIIDYVYRQGGYAWRASSVGIYDGKRQMYRTAPKKGVADILCCYEGKFIAIEIKIGKDIISMEQAGFLENINNTRGYTFIAKDFAGFRKWWKECPGSSLIVTRA